MRPAAATHSYFRKDQMPCGTKCAVPIPKEGVALKGGRIRLQGQPCRSILQSDIAISTSLVGYSYVGTKEAAADVDPRSCPSAGAIACKYWR